MTTTFSSRREFSKSASVDIDDTESSRLVQESQENTTESPEPFILEDLVTDMLRACGRRKQRIANTVLDRIRSEEDAAKSAAWAAYMILASSTPGRIDDCVGLLSRLGPNVVANALRDAFVQRPPQGANKTSYIEDYGFVLTRTLGLLSKQMGPETFRSEIQDAARSSFAGVREAAVYAMADIGDAQAIRHLRNTAADDPSPIIRSLACEMLEEVEQPAT